MMKTNVSFCVLAGLWLCADFARSETRPARDVGKKSAAMRAVTGPAEPINRAVAAGATAIFTLQPVPPKTLPATSYPPGSSIVGQTLRLGSVPTRVWIESELTGWAPETLKSYQFGISANDPEMDGGGYLGSAARCAGNAVIGAGDLRPAQQVCPSTNNAGHSFCSAALAGHEGCGQRPVHCQSMNGTSPDYLPAGLWCSPGYQDYCHPKDINLGILSVSAMDISTVNFRWGMSADPGEVPTDFMPSYLATIVLDVPADAKGTYILDAWEQEVFLVNWNLPGSNEIPIAEIRSAIIHVVSCSTNSQCNDGDACTEDLCQDGCCTNMPLADWNQETECCNPATGAQGQIPQSSVCRTGGCSLGGNLGVPTVTNVSDGTACTSPDPCFGEGACQAGVCASEQYAGPDCPKVRFISFETGADATMKAYRVTLVSLHHPNPPYAGGPVSDFSSFEGEVRWVGASSLYGESTANPIPVHAAVLGCSPHYQDWSGVELLHVGGAEIIPSSVYAVQSIEQGLDTNVESNYSEPLLIATARWGDVVIPYSQPGGSGQPDFGDVSALIDKFRGLPTSVSKPRAVILGSGPSGIPDLSGDVNFAEIAATNDAFRGRPYPYSGPMPCP